MLFRIHYFLGFARANTKRDGIVPSEIVDQKNKKTLKNRYDLHSLRVDEKYHGLPTVRKFRDFTGVRRIVVIT